MTITFTTAIGEHWNDHKEDKNEDPENPEADILAIALASLLFGLLCEGAGFFLWKSQLGRYAIDPCMMMLDNASVMMPSRP